MRACNRVTLPLLLHYAIKYFFDPLCFIRNITQRIRRFSTRNKDCERNNELISVRKVKAETDALCLVYKTIKLYYKLCKSKESYAPFSWGVWW